MLGLLRDNIFIREAHLKDFGIEADVAKDPATDAVYKFMSHAALPRAQGGVDVAGMALQGASTSSELTIAFTKEESVYFLLTQCAGAAICNQIKLRNKILGTREDQRVELGARRGH